ncbi:MAG: ATP-grasp domain-containing protein [Actinomycetota bacterium]|nr:ATP-grasp domain-containing protein [Actinomycetota bacterium]MDQ2957587.1 ATP-grasp domain-containing protein [Actinomycetota bacterium]
MVDPFSTGQEYPAAFRAAGVEPVAVLALPEPAEPFRESWHPENFQHIVVFDGDLTALAETVRSYQPLCVIPGAESGVELADALVELVLPGTANVPELAAARRDKWPMAQAVSRAGLPHIRQIGSADPDEIEQWLGDTGLRSGPLVVKPPKSGGTDEVHFVATGAEWRPFFDQIYGHINEDGLLNDMVLVQEFVEGTEYLIDSYSVDGRHGLVDACRYTKQQRGDRIGIYDLVDFLPPDHPGVLATWPYTQQVLDAVGIRNGCCHSEVIMTVDGPRLVEVNARPAGGGHQMITRLATGGDQIERTVAHRVRGEYLDSYQLLQNVCSVVISAPRAGIWRNAEIFAAVDSLETFHMKHFYFATGDVVPPATGLSSMLGWVVLASPDRAAFEADYRRIKEIERQLDVDPLVADTIR